jgi:hypothetical protein
VCNAGVRRSHELETAHLGQQLTDEPDCASICPSWPARNIKDYKTAVQPTVYHLRSPATSILLLTSQNHISSNREIARPWYILRSHTLLYHLTSCRPKTGRSLSVAVPCLSCKVKSRLACSMLLTSFAVKTSTRTLAFPRLSFAATSRAARVLSWRQSPRYRFQQVLERSPCVSVASMTDNDLCH